MVEEFVIDIKDIATTCMYKLLLNVSLLSNIVLNEVRDAMIIGFKLFTCKFSSFFVKTKSAK